MTSLRKFILAVVVALTPAAAHAQGIVIPNTFVNGTAADADQVNANFTALANAALNRTAGTMTGTLNVQAVTPVTDALYALGDATHRFTTGFFTGLNVTGATTLNTLAYTWPGSQSASAFLQTNGSGTLAWTAVSIPVVNNQIVGGRVTLTTGVPVTTADVTAATSVYFTPYAGNRIALYDGASTWNLRTFAELTLAVPNTTNTLYDVFIYDNAGTPAIEALAWANDGARATNLVLQDGVPVKSGATTRRYVGNFRTGAVAGQTEDSVAKRWCVNYYNRVRRAVRVTESADTWNYTTDTYRQAFANTANQVDVIAVGLQAEALLSLRVVGLFTSGSADQQAVVSVGEDSTTTALAGVIGQGSGSTATGVGAGSPVQTVAVVDRYPPIGRHFYVWLERANGAGVVAWYGDNTSSAKWQAGMSGWIEG